MDPVWVAVSGLLRDYHLQTEHEKALHGVTAGGVTAGGVTAGGVAGAALPARYRVEVDDPAEAFAGAAVAVAEDDVGAVGVVVLQPSGRDVELKRLWVAPAGRRRGVAAALVTYASEHAERAEADGLRLSVWDWRSDALALYRSRGFTVEPSWESRERLVCLRRALD
ncbi:GNAT family N-acetyltransferase [Microbacterium arborescens]|uniref:GNAT family N-acetyltransferase n=1 Tax=Microbacterium TaxID=33882 RepID=UPI0025A1FF10|nr:GNAT family N-acetyltransferase [Microbacterium arborescens]WJM15511.1 GNAT family N-acetyltransferase [Microbacterium arborescens]